MSDSTHKKTPVGISDRRLFRVIFAFQTDFLLVVCEVFRLQVLRKEPVGGCLFGDHLNIETVVAVDLSLKDRTENSFIFHSSKPP